MTDTSEAKSVPVPPDRVLFEYITQQPQAFLLVRPDGLTDVEWIQMVEEGAAMFAPLQGKAD